VVNGGSRSRRGRVDQEEATSDSEIWFVYEFFISEEKNRNVEGGGLQDKDECEVKPREQSVTFFLPDFCRDEI
jgi:hypothetical protein